jgi:chaperone modulatory protein CbpM
MRDDDILIGALVDEAALTLEELAWACAVNPDWVVRHVDEGVLQVRGQAWAEWRFSARELRRARRIRAIEHDFEAEPQLAALVADLVEEIEALRLRLRRAGLE